MWCICSVLEDFGISGATTVCTAAATFGLVAGSLMGGPIGNKRIKKHNLLETIKNDDDTLLVEEEARKTFFDVCAGCISAYNCGRYRHDIFKIALAHRYDISNVHRSNDCSGNYA